MSSTSADKKAGQGAQKVKAASSVDKEIEDIINEEYKNLQKINKFPAFYHAVHDIVGKLNDKEGAIQFKLPTEDELSKLYNYHVGEGKLSEEKFKKIMMEIITFEKMSIGKAARDTILFIFGAPIGALFAKRFIPGGGSLSDDIFLPAVTSLTVFILARKNML